MKIDVLYFDECPNHRAAIQRIEEILEQEGTSAEISEVNVGHTTAAQEIFGRLRIASAD